jgi:hypothetical protein
VQKNTKQKKPNSKKPDGLKETYRPKKPKKPPRVAPKPPNK